MRPRAPAVLAYSPAWAARARARASRRHASTGSSTAPTPPTTTRVLGVEVAPQAHPPRGGGGDGEHAAAPNPLVSGGATHPARWRSLGTTQQAPAGAGSMRSPQQRQQQQQPSSPSRSPHDDAASHRATLQDMCSNPTADIGKAVEHYTAHLHPCANSQMVLAHAVASRADAERVLLTLTADPGCVSKAAVAAVLLVLFRKAAAAVARALRNREPGVPPPGLAFSKKYVLRMKEVFPHAFTEVHIRCLGEVFADLSEEERRVLRGGNRGRRRGGGNPAAAAAPRAPHRATATPAARLNTAFQQLIDPARWPAGTAPAAIDALKLLTQPDGSPAGAVTPQHVDVALRQAWVQADADVVDRLTELRGVLVSGGGKRDGACASGPAGGGGAAAASAGATAPPALSTSARFNTTFMRFINPKHWGGKGAPSARDMLRFLEDAREVVTAQHLKIALRQAWVRCDADIAAALERWEGEKLRGVGSGAGGARRDTEKGSEVAVVTIPPPPPLKRLHRGSSAPPPHAAEPRGGRTHATTAQPTTPGNTGGAPEPVACTSPAPEAAIDAAGPPVPSAPQTPATAPPPVVTDAQRFNTAFFRRLATLVGGASTSTDDARRSEQTAAAAQIEHYLEDNAGWVTPVHLRAALRQPCVAGDAAVVRRLTSWLDAMRATPEEAVFERMDDADDQHGPRGVGYSMARGAGPSSSFTSSSSPSTAIPAAMYAAMVARLPPALREDPQAGAQAADVDGGPSPPSAPPSQAVRNGLAVDTFRTGYRPRPVPRPATALCGSRQEVMRHCYNPEALGAAAVVEVAEALAWRPCESSTASPPAGTAAGRGTGARTTGVANDHGVHILLERLARRMCKGIIPYERDPTPFITDNAHLLLDAPTRARWHALGGGEAGPSSPSTPLTPASFCALGSAAVRLGNDGVRRMLLQGYCGFLAGATAREASALVVSSSHEQQRTAQPDGGGGDGANATATRPLRDAARWALKTRCIALALVASEVRAAAASTPPPSATSSAGAEVKEARGGVPVVLRRLAADVLEDVVELSKALAAVGTPLRSLVLGAEAASVLGISSDAFGTTLVDVCRVAAGNVADGPAVLAARARALRRLLLAGSTIASPQATVDAVHVFVAWLTGCTAAGTPPSPRTLAYTLKALLPVRQHLISDERYRTALDLSSRLFRDSVCPWRARARHTALPRDVLDTLSGMAAHGLPLLPVAHVRLVFSYFVAEVESELISGPGSSSNVPAKRARGQGVRIAPKSVGDIEDAALRRVKNRDLAAAVCLFCRVNSHLDIAALLVRRITLRHVRGVEVLTPALATDLAMHLSRTGIGAGPVILSLSRKVSTQEWLLVERHSAAHTDNAVNIFAKGFVPEELFVGRQARWA